jgi:hypothetical protein
VIVALVTGAAIVGWFVPLLGISLLAFLLIDAVIGLRQSTPTHTSETV